MKIVVSGSGRWGTAMALYCNKIGHQVSLLCSRKESYAFIQKNQFSIHLEKFPLDKNIQILSPTDSIPPETELIIFSVPIPFFRQHLEQLQSVQKYQTLLTINKGIEQKSLLLSYQILEEFFPQNQISHLGGPCFPEGLLKEEKPAAETLACRDKKLGKKLQQELSSLWFRIYQSDDLKGTCFLGAVKNCFAIISGIISGKKLGQEAQAILITRGIYEIKKLCKVLDIPEFSIYGLSGLGDLVLTCYSEKSSQNKNFGYQIGIGKSVEEIKKELKNKICEGYFTTQALFDLAKKYNIEVPFIEALHKVLYENIPITQALQGLIQRPLKIED